MILGRGSTVALRGMPRRILHAPYPRTKEKTTRTFSDESMSDEESVVEESVVEESVDKEESVREYESVDEEEEDVSEDSSSRSHQSVSRAPPRSQRRERSSNRQRGRMVQTLLADTNWKERFVWRSFPWLDNIVENSRVTSVIETPGFLRLYKDINTLQKQNRAPKVSKRQLKVRLYSPMI
jgi:hypothetical protein